MKIYNSFENLIKDSGSNLLNWGQSIAVNNWQGLENREKNIPNLHELFQYSVKVPMVLDMDILSKFSDQPWAENHFQERISGNPTNPGDTYKDWPYYREGEYRKEIFTHTYQERFWPKYANGGVENYLDSSGDWAHRGIRYEYGDLNDVIQLLKKDKNTRQAFLPIFFPEDTGAVHGGRIPCTLGYLFNIRKGFLHMTYYIRSCDYIRHFHNDLYLANRLAMHIREKLLDIYPDLFLGFLTMHIESFHCFESDLLELKKRIK